LTSEEARKEGNWNKMLATFLVITIPLSTILFFVFSLEYKVAGILLGCIIGVASVLILLHTEFFTVKQISKGFGFS
jgi:hypothetical protein